MKKILLFGAAALIAASASAASENVLVEMYPGSEQLNGWGVEGLLTQSENEVKITNPAEATNFWDVQIAYDMEFTEGTTYYISFDVKGDPGTITSGFQEKGTYAGCGNFEDFEIKSDWNTVTIKGTAGAANGVAANRWVANLGKYAGTFYIAKLKIYTLDEGQGGGDEPAGKTLDMLPSLSNDAYDAATKTITFGASWGWVNWWFGDGNFSEYDNFVLEFEPVSYTVQVMVQYNEGDDQAVQAQAGESKIVVPLDASRKNSIKQIAIQNSEPGTLTLTAAYFAAAAGVHTPSAASVLNGVYNLNGVKVADELNTNLPKGIYIVGGKKVVR